MSQEVTIRIQLTLPDGATFRIVTDPVEDDFEKEPLPLETFAAEEADGFPLNAGPIGPAPQPIPVTPTPAFRNFAPQPQAQAWQPGMTHQQGHKPLKANRRGLFCPTKIGTDPQGNAVFCPWPSAA